MRAWVSALTVLLLAAGASPAMAGPTAGLVLILTATDDAQAQWLVKAHRLRSVRRGPGLIGVLLSGRVRCTGRDCVGRRGRFSASLAADQSLVATGTFRASATSCAFLGPLQIDAATVTFRCVKAGGAVVSKGSAQVTRCRGVGCVAPAS